MKFELLIIDDDKIAVLIHQKMLLKSNFHKSPLSFLNASDALHHILNYNSSDITYCILLDINMPEMNGWNFLEAISEYDIHAQIRVIMVTSSIDPADKQKAHTYRQVIEFIAKPISVESLQRLKQHDSLKLFFNSVEN